VQARDNRSRKLPTVRSEAREKTADQARNHTRSTKMPVAAERKFWWVSHQHLHEVRQPALAFSAAVNFCPVGVGDEADRGG